MHDGAAQRVGASEELRGLLHLAVGKRVADACGGDGAVLEREQLDRLHLEADVLADLGEAVDGALAVAAEGEVLADHEQAHAGFFVEHAREVLGGHLRELGGELHDRHEVEPGRAQPLDAGLERGEVGDLDVGPEHRDGVRVEGDEP